MLDWCMVYNPTSEDFYIEWLNTQGRPWKYLVPSKNKDIGFGKGQYETQRYLAIWYCTHMKDKIINDKILKEGYDKLKEREEKGLPQLTKFEEQKAIWDKTPRTNSNKELAALYPILWLGVTREFGMDYTPSEGPQNIDQTTPEEKVLDSMKNKKYTSTTSQDIPQSKIKEKLPSIDELESLIKGEDGQA